MAEQTADGAAQDTAPVRRRSSFGRTVVLGLAAGIAAAVAGNQAWVSVDKAGADQVVGGAGVQLSVLADASAPPVTALALVLLATWGVVLVTRGRFRRVIAWLGLLAAIGTAAFAVLVWLKAADDVRTTLAAPDLPMSHTAWSYIGVLAGLAAVAGSVAAVRGVARWPEMGRRYDAPGADAPPEQVPLAERTNLDLWRSIDEGRDPTEQDDH